MIRSEYTQRTNEIESFYEILKIIELESPKISGYNIENSETEILNVSSEKIDTLRSTVYLLLYNLIESTVYNSIMSIFDEIKDNNLKYFDVIRDIQKYWINNIYKHDDKKKKETIVETIMTVANQIFDNTMTLASNEINYGGSLDAQTIFNTARSMNIDIGNLKKIYSPGKHGQVLIDIKQKRNWLAHGEKSFSEVGSTITFSQLNEAKDCVLAFLNEYITSIENYILQKRYMNNTCI